MIKIDSIIDLCMMVVSISRSLYLNNSSIFFMEMHDNTSQDDSFVDKETGTLYEVIKNNIRLV